MLLPLICTSLFVLSNQVIEPEAAPKQVRVLILDG
ncbi:MAG: hypothetical protein ACI8QZ_003483, partial [Chlamydiales bacterium]